MQTTSEQADDLGRQIREAYEQYEDGAITESEMEAKVWFLDCQLEALNPLLQKADMVEIDLDLMRPKA